MATKTAQAQPLAGQARPPLLLRCGRWFENVYLLGSSRAGTASRAR